MSFIGGEVLEIVCKHSLGTFRFLPKGEEDFTVDLGGIRNEVMVTASGQTIQKKKRAPWSIDGNVTIDINSEGAENINRLAESTEEGIWSITHISGAVYRGQGVPVDDLNFTTAEAQFKLKASGGGKLSPIN